MHNIYNWIGKIFNRSIAINIKEKNLIKIYLNVQRNEIEFPMIRK